MWLEKYRASFFQKFGIKAQISVTLNTFVCGMCVLWIKGSSDAVR